MANECMAVRWMPGNAQAANAIDSPTALGELSSALEAAFGSQFSLLDAETGDVLAAAADHARFDWTLHAELCREVGRRNQVEWIEDVDPLVLLAIPLEDRGGRALVAVGAFLTRRIEAGEQAPSVARLLGISGADSGQLAAAANSLATRTARGVARLLVGKIAAERQAERRSREIADVSGNLSSTYEEISLLYRLTQNLKLSSRDEELGQKALDWLAEVVPVEALALLLVPLSAGAASHGARTEPVLLTHGPCPLDAAGMAELVQTLAPGQQRPVVLNHGTTAAADWPYPAVRQLIVVPLVEGTKVFGWLAAVNHARGLELGTVEASLLTSVAAILGIHSGNAELYREQAEFFADVVRALTSAIDAKDPYTCGHSNRVARVSVRLAQEMGLSTEQVNTIYLSGLLHDIGKIGIDDTVLRKPGALTPEEYEHIKAHAEIGHRILAEVKKLDEVLPVVLHHHEQWDGRGYPHKLAGNAIPQLARICAVADAFDAMGSDRPYRKGMPEVQLDGILRPGAGQQWDAEVVDAFFRARDDIREISRRERENLVLDVDQWA